MNKSCSVDICNEKFIKVKIPFIRKMTINKAYIDNGIRQGDNIIVKNSPSRKVLLWLFWIMLVVSFLVVILGKFPLISLLISVPFILYSIIVRIILLKKNLWVYYSFAIGIDFFILSLSFFMISVNDYLERFNSIKYLILMFFSLIVIVFSSIFVCFKSIQNDVYGKTDDKPVKVPLHILYMFIGINYALKPFLNDDMKCVESILANMLISYSLIFGSVVQFVRFYFIKKLKYKSPDDVGKEID